MKRFFRVLYRLFLYGILLGTTAGMLGGLWVYHNQDKIIGFFVQELNKNLNTEVSVGQMQLTFWEKFPRLAISFDNVVVNESIPGSTEPMARIKRLYFTFNLRKILEQQYEIEEIYAENGEVTIRTDAKGRANYQILKSDSATADANPVDFRLKAVHLDQMVLSYISAPQNQAYHLTAQDLDASAQRQGPRLELALQGNTKIRALEIAGERYLQEKPLYLDTRFNLEDGIFTLKPSTLQVEGAEFGLSGAVDNRKTTRLDLHIDSRDTHIRSLLALMPGSLYQELKVYESQGDIYFSADLTGPVSSRSSPKIDVKFGCSQASFYHPQLGRKIKKVSFKGHYSNGARQSLASSSLKIEELTALLDGRLIRGDFRLQNFQDPRLKAGMEGKISLDALQDFYPLPGVKKASGMLDLALNFEGRISELETLSRQTRFRSDGELQLEGVALKLSDRPLTFQSLNGRLLFNRNDLAINELNGLVNGETFYIRGLLVNLIPYLLFDNQKLMADLNLEAEYLDLNDWQPQESAQATQENEPEPQIPHRTRLMPQLDLKLDFLAKSLRYDSTRLDSLRFDLRLKNEKLQLNNFLARVAGGRLSGQAELSTQNPKNYYLASTSLVEHLPVQNLFRLFDNFEQDFLTHKQIRGQIRAESQVIIPLDSFLNPLPKRAYAEVDTRIEEGQLVAFKPAMELSTFLEEDQLRNLQFQTLENHFVLDSGKLTIPQMEIRSNAFNITVMGSQSLEGDLSYRIKVPMENLKKRPDPDQAFGAIQESEGQGINLFLKIEGTTDDFTVSYDKKAVGEAVKDRWVREKQDMKELFRKKQQEKESAPGLDTQQFFSQ